MDIGIKIEIYEDAQLIKKMKSPDDIKIKVLGSLLGRFDDIWRVVGITENALKVFAEHNFKKESGMNINRSHLKDRSQTYPHLIKADLSFEAWWEYLIDHNYCVLATSSENMKGESSWSRRIDIDPTLGLFKSSGFAWKHRLKKEGAYLKQLYEISQIN